MNLDLPGFGREGWLVLVACMALAFPAEAQPPPTLAVLLLEAKTGVAPETAEAITDNLVDEIRRSAAFSRVVAQKEIQALLDFEMQRQLAQCSEDSCVAELAGALGVDFILTGSVAKLGGSYLFNARLLHVRSVTAASAISLRLRSDTDEALLDAVKPAVIQLITEARLLNPEARKRMDHYRANPVGPPTAPPSEPAHRWRLPLGVAGAVMEVGAVVFTVLAGGMLASSVVVGVVPRLVVLPWGGLDYMARVALVDSTALGLGGLAGVHALIALLAFAAGLATVVVGLIL